MYKLFLSGNVPNEYTFCYSFFFFFESLATAQLYFSRLEKEGLTGDFHCLVSPLMQKEHDSACMMMMMCQPESVNGRKK